MNTKRQSQTAKIAELTKQSQQLFGIVVQLGKEVSQMGTQTNTMLEVMRGMPGFEESLEIMKTAQENAEQSTQETSTSTAPVVDYGDDTV